jgi:hypothetical protein
MAIESDYLIVESVGEVDEPYLCEDVVPNTSFSNMESVHLKSTISLKNEVLQLVTIKAQAILWKPHH